MSVSWEAVTAIAAILALASAGFAFLVNLMVRTALQEQFAAFREWASREFATERELIDMRREFEDLRLRVKELEG